MFGEQKFSFYGLMAALRSAVLICDADGLVLPGSSGAVRGIAPQGMVLLKNAQNALPPARDERVSAFGRGQIGRDGLRKCAVRVVRAMLEFKNIKNKSKNRYPFVKK